MMTREQCLERMKSFPTGGFYRHYNGGLYYVTGGSLRESDGAPLVNYRGVIGKTDFVPDVVPWSRPVSEWHEIVTDPETGENVPRYRKCKKPLGDVS